MVLRAAEQVAVTWRITLSLSLSEFSVCHTLVSPTVFIHICFGIAL